MNFKDPASRKKLVFIPAVFAAFTAGAYFFALKNDFDFEIQHFAPGSVPFILLSVFLILSAAFSLCAYIPARKRVYSENPPTPLFMIFAASFTAILASALFIYKIPTLARYIKLIATPQYLSASLGGYQRPLLYLRCTEIITLPFVSAAFLSFVIPAKNASLVKFRCFASILGCLSLTVSLFASYFDFSDALNGAVRNLTTIVEACTALFTLSETRLIFPEDDSRRSYPMSVGLSCITSSAALGLSLGALLFRIFCPNAADPNPALLRSALYFGISLAALARLTTLSSCSSPKTDDDNGDNIENSGTSTDTDGGDKD